MKIAVKVLALLFILGVFYSMFCIFNRVASAL
jgi:hypothetical protein